MLIPLHNPNVLWMGVLQWLNVMSLSAGFIVIKTLIITAIGPRAGLTLQESLRIGVLLSQGGEFGFVVCNERDLLGLDGAFMKGPFPGQVLVAVGLDSNNGIYPLAYALVEAESKSSWCWFLQCLGDDIDLHPNSNFTFISDRQNVEPNLNLLLNNFCVIDKCTGPLTPTATRIMESIKKKAYLMKVQWNGANKYQVLGSLGDQSCWNIALNDQAAPPSENVDKSCMVEYMEGNILSQGGNNSEASSSAFRQAQQTEPVVGQDGSGGSGVGAIIGLFAAVVVRFVHGGLVSETRNADGREMGDGVPTQSSTAVGASEWSFRSNQGLGGGGYLKDYVRVVGGTDDEDSDSELPIPTSWSDESKNEKGQKDKGTDVMKDKVSQEHVCEEVMPLNNNIGKQVGDFVDMPSEAVEQGMDVNVPDKINGAKGEQVPNHVVKKGNLEFLVCKRLQTLVLMN
ncbi:putative ribonuclease H-like domain-containing protein [Tanacetum coccineum]